MRCCCLPYYLPCVLPFNIPIGTDQTMHQEHEDTAQISPQVVQVRACLPVPSNGLTCTSCGRTTTLPACLDVSAALFDVGPMLQLLERERDELKAGAIELTTLRCLPPLAHKDTQQRRVPPLYLWCATLTLWHVCQGAAGATARGSGCK